MQTENAKRPSLRGEGRAAAGDQNGKPISVDPTREAAIGQAAAWYAAHRCEAARPLIPNIARQFSLSTAEAAKALAIAWRAA